MTTITLESAQRFYGTLVPWELDETDLPIINRYRKISRNSDDMEGINKQKIVDALWKKAEAEADDEI